MAAARSSPSPAGSPGGPPARVPFSGRPAIAACAAALLVFIAGAVSAFIVRTHLIDAAQGDFDDQAAHITGDVRRELSACTQVVRGTSGFIAALPQPIADGATLSDGWDRYIARLDLDDAPPCVRTLGYAAVLPDALGAPPPAGGAPSTAAARAGAAESTDALARAVVTWPLREASDGRLLGTRPATHAALLRAADTAQPAVSVDAGPRGTEADVAATRTDTPSRSRVELYLPIYRVVPPPAAAAARRALLEGFIVARLDTEYLFASVAAHEPRVALQVTAGPSAIPLYPPGAPRSVPVPHDKRFAHTDTLRFGGESFAITYGTNDPSLTAAADFSTGAILASALAAAIIAGLGAFLFERRRGSTLVEAGVARNLSSSNEARMMAIIRSSGEAIITIDETQRIVIFNPAAERVFGCSAMEAIGSSIERFIPDRFREMHRRHVEQFGVTGVSERRMGKQRVLYGLRANGEEFPIEASISQIRDGGGKLYTVMLRDVTERVRADEELKVSQQELRNLSANLQKVREEEKTRIARELHDDLGQQLTALKMDLSSVEQSLETNDAVAPTVVGQLRGMRRLIDTTVASARRIAADLRPVMLDDLGLMPAIDWLINDFTTRYGIEVERRIEIGATQFSRNGGTTVFRILQEALTNIARHAEATQVTVTLAVTGEHCLLRIADNGRGATQGADANGTREKTFGLLGIRERAHILGGSVSIETALQRGFTITVNLPLAAIQQEEALP